MSSPVLAALSDWAGAIMAIIMTLALGSETLFKEGSPSLNGMFVAMILTLATGRYYWRVHLKNGNTKGLAAELEGPLLLVVAAWAIFRFGESFLPNLIIVPAMVVAWITVRYYGLIPLVCILIGVVVEVELALTGHQTFLLAGGNISICLIVVLALHLFPGSKLYRTSLRQKLKDIDREHSSREQAMEMGLAPDLIAAPGLLHDTRDIDPARSFRQQTVESIGRSFELQLEMIRLALNLTSVAVLWPGQGNGDLRLRHLATSRKDIDSGPYQIGAGITGALSGREEMELVGVKPSHPALPYYRKAGGVGAIMALRIAAGQEETAKPGILCVDREADVPWSDRERQILRLAGKKLGLEIRGCRLLLNLERDRTTIHHLYHGLRELNSDPNLEAIFATSVRVVQAQVQTDLLTLCLREGERYQIVLAEGNGAEKLIDQYFPIADGLVGQAMKTAKTMPAGGRYLGAAPIFTNDQTYPGFKSLLVIPLPDEDNVPIGCLVVAAKSPGVFSKNRQEILEIIAAQIAIKVKLGQAHEQLALLATTDGLTGLANHRTFQFGLEAMLERAKRNRTPLCLLLADLDHFKSVNDNYGHPFGDQILQKVAEVLMATVRTVDLASRYGGEEFAIVLENSDAEDARVLAERMREKIAQLNLGCADTPVPVTVSIGIACFPKHCGEKGRLIDQADQALYLAKKAGRNRTVVWSAETTA